MGKKEDRPRDIFIFGDFPRYQSQAGSTVEIRANRRIKSSLLSDLYLEAGIIMLLQMSFCNLGISRHFFLLFILFVICQKHMLQQSVHKKANMCMKRIRSVNQNRKCETYKCI